MYRVTYLRRFNETAYKLIVFRCNSLEEVKRSCDNLKRQGEFIVDIERVQ